MAKPRKKSVKAEKQPQNNQHASVKKQQFHVEFLNAAVLNERYQHENKPIVVDFDIETKQFDYL